MVWATRHVRCVVDTSGTPGRVEGGGGSGAELRAVLYFVSNCCFLFVFRCIRCRCGQRVESGLGHITLTIVCHVSPLCHVSHVPPMSCVLPRPYHKYSPGFFRKGCGHTCGAMYHASCIIYHADYAVYHVSVMYVRPSPLLWRHACARAPHRTLTSTLLGVRSFCLQAAGHGRGSGRRGVGGNIVVT